MAAKASAPLVGVYCHPTECMLRDVFPVLQHFGLPFVTLDRVRLRRLTFGEVDVLLFPGGWYFFKETVARRIRAFVRAGGGYVGICCGQINAVKLGLLNAKLYSMSGIGPTWIEPVDGRHPVLRGVVKRSRKKWREYER